MVSITDGQFFGLYLALCMDVFMDKTNITPKDLPPKLNTMYYNLRRNTRMITLHNIIIVMDYVGAKNMKELLDTEISSDYDLPTQYFIEQFGFTLDGFINTYKQKRKSLFGF